LIAGIDDYNDPAGPYFGMKKNIKIINKLMMNAVLIIKR